ncbi:acid protease [Epithele typhae]|uniref:acid protease n=1 Tax=Epithele typhae TaxID=378194 RepID=UPI002007537E|nr:acid protease [Epithele typhae]KAH9939100.1 acid protease [Epithele typhae]
MLATLPPLLVLTVLDALARPAFARALPSPPPTSTPTTSRRQARPSDGHHPVSVSRAEGAGVGLGFTAAEDQLYTATLYVNGVPYQVLLDTGSGDTWIDPLSVGGAVPPDLVPTGVNSTQRYVDGSSFSGPIVLADVQFGPYTVHNQAISVAYGAVATSPSTEGLFNGVLGLGGVDLSSVYTRLRNTKWEANAVSTMFNVFAHLPDEPAYSTWLPSRNEIGFADGGVLTFSEVLADKTDVLTAPRIPSVFTSSWTALLDGIYINGRFLSGGSTATNALANRTVVPEGSMVASLDTGTSFIQGLKRYAEQVYVDVPGARREVQPDGDELWRLPCDTKVNVSLSFGGIEYPIHPADLSRVAVLDDGELACYGTFVGTEVPDQDFLLGDTFLRNVYALYGYPDPTDPHATPYARLLSVTDPARAWAEADAVLADRLRAFEEPAAVSWDEDEDEDEDEEVSPTARPSYTGTRPVLSLVSSPTPAHAPASPSPTVSAPASSLPSSSSSSPALWIAAVALGCTALALAALAWAAVAQRRRRTRRRRGAFGAGRRPGEKWGAEDAADEEEEVELLSAVSDDSPVVARRVRPW